MTRNSIINIVLVIIILCSVFASWRLYTFASRMNFLMSYMEKLEKNQIEILDNQKLTHESMNILKERQDEIMNNQKLILQKLK